MCRSKVPGYKCTAWMAFPLRTGVDPGCGCEMTNMCSCCEGDPLPGTTTGTSGRRTGGGGGTFSDINDGKGWTADEAVSSWTLLTEVESFDSMSNIFDTGRLSSGTETIGVSTRTAIPHPYDASRNPAHFFFSYFPPFFFVFYFFKVSGILRQLRSPLARGAKLGPSHTPLARSDRLSE